MSDRWSSVEADDDEEVIGASASNKSSPKSRFSKIKKISAKSVNEMPEKIEKSINNEMIVKPVEDEMATVVDTILSDWTTVSDQTVVSDRVVEERSLSPNKSCSSMLSSTKYDTLYAQTTKNNKNDYALIAETARKASPFVADFGFRWSHFLKPQPPGFSESPKQQENVEFVETTGVELPDHDSRLGSPITVQNRVDDDSIDRNDDSGDRSGHETHLRGWSHKTHLEGWDDEVLTVSRRPKIVTRPDDFLRMWFAKSPVTLPPAQAPSPPKIKFHPHQLEKSNQLWDEFVSNNPEDFKHVQNLTKRKFFKSGRLKLGKGDTREVPAKKRKESKTKRERSVQSSSAAPNMITVHGTIHRRRGKDRSEVTSDSSENDRERPRRVRFAERMRSLESPSPSSLAITKAEKALKKDRRSKRKIDEISRSRSIEKNDRSPKRSRVEDRTDSRNEPEVVRSPVVGEDTHAIEKLGQSKRKIGKASGSRSISGNDRRSSRVRIAERTRKRTSRSASNSTITKSPRDDRLCDLGAQKDRKTARSTIVKSPDFMAEVRQSVSSKDHRSDQRSSIRSTIESPGKSSCEDLSIVIDKIDAAPLEIGSVPKIIITRGSTSPDDPKLNEPTIDESSITDSRNELPVPSRLDGTLPEMVKPPKKRGERSSKIYKKEDRAQIDIDPRSESKYRRISVRKKREQKHKLSSTSNRSAKSRQNKPIIVSEVVYPPGTAGLVTIDRRPLKNIPPK